MKERKRMHRRDPVRGAPDRKWRNLLRDAGSWGQRDSGDSDPASSSKDGESPESWNDVVDRGVDLGYRVINQEIRRGRKMAAEINDRSYSIGMMGRDAQDLGVRLARYSGEAWGLWIDLLRSPFVGWDPGRGPLRPFTAEPHHAPGVAIEVLSARRARVDLHLEPGCDVRRLAALELRSTDAKKAPLKQVAFEHEPDGRGVSLSIRVPDSQPAGVYSGVVVDRESGQPLGTLSVRVAE